MNEPVRLREGQGPAAVLMRGARLPVPPASRQRALTFASSVAVGVVATSAASAAGAASLAKSFLVYLAIGTVGGGALSLAATKLVSELDAPSAAVTAGQRAPAPVEGRSVAPLALPAEPAPAPPIDEPANDGVSGDRSPPAELPRTLASEARRSMPASSLYEEQRAIEQARAAISRGDTGAGLGLLDDYERKYARRQFGPEALALRVEALRHQGQLVPARARASEFERRYPRHPLLPRVRELAR